MCVGLLVGDGDVGGGVAGFVGQEWADGVQELMCDLYRFCWHVIQVSYLVDGGLCGRM